MARSAAWWKEFEERVDRTGVSSGDPLVSLFMETQLPEPRPLCRQDFQDALRTMLGDPENKTPIVMSVYTDQGWVNYTFEVADLELIRWFELPTLVAMEGPENFREVVALAKSAYDSRCGYLSPTIQRLPVRFINDLKEVSP